MKTPHFSKKRLAQAVTYALCSTLFLTGLPHKVLANNTPNTTAIALSAEQTAQGFTLINTTINKSPNDKAIYQGITLANGMTVLLISDEKANKSLMAMALPIGSMEDPINQQGLAHYLEHMVLMGSKNYPETNSLDQFLNQNGGYNNASTDTHRTAYYLEVNHNAFDEAVTRFADTLAFPLLSEANAKKEINAVNAEMIRAKSSEGHLLNSVATATVNPAHPWTKLTVGNHETLSDKPNSPLQKALEQFYQQYYSADLFKAVLYSNQSIEQLAKLAEKTLGKMAKKTVALPQIDVPLLRDEDKGVIIQYKPIKPLKLLSISFQIDSEEKVFYKKTGDYLSYVFSNNTEGTLSDYLIKQGLSDSGIQAESSFIAGRNLGTFSFYVLLTDKGIKEKDKIISMIFQQIEKVKKEGVQASYFSEMKQSLSQAFAHLEIEKNGDYIESLAEKMLFYPLAHILDANYLAEEMDNDAIHRQLSAMNMDNARILFIEEGAKTDKKTAHFEANYGVEKITPAQKQKWLDFSQNPELALPELNPYFATDFSLVNQEKRQKPKLIQEDKGRKIYAMTSHSFSDMPKARLAFVADVMPKTDDAKAVVSAIILGYMNNLAQVKLHSQSAVAGITTGLELSSDALLFSAEGYTQHLAKLIEDNLVQFSQFELSETILTQAKQRFIDALDSQKKENSLKQANAFYQHFSTYPYFEEDKTRKIIAEITLNDIQHIRTKLLSQATGVRLLSVGNFNDEQVQSLVNTIEKVVKNKNEAVGKWRYVDVNESERKLNFIKSVPNEDNALSIAYMAKGYEEWDGRSHASLLKDIISRWYFDDLRTNKQLGYVVYSTSAQIGKTAGIRFLVQSPNATPKEIMRHNQRFFEESFAKLNALTEAEFEQFKQSLLTKLSEKPESLAEEWDTFVFDALRNNAQFDHKEKRIQAVKKLTKSDIVQFYQDTVISAKGLVLLSQALGTKTKPEDAFLPEHFERVESIEALQKTFEVKEH